MPDNNNSLDDSVDLDDPIVKLFRKVMLESIAREEKSDLYCSHCGTNLPYNRITVGYVANGVDANFNPVKKLEYFCTLCQKPFDKK